ncbi:hypothetical protein H4R34_003701 [Dimargaris verticillata]|uniref:FAD/NAD(P)-binding domain-containing protein n=1 Tax=Dimargaris verticillata TaxID=2761393 RepID=A0A9W8B5R1_9FUNG|nr:hypothetical protein H4R34_003701 [Dimargaris verticillata]
MHQFGTNAYHVVVVGGSFAGLMAAQELEKQAAHLNVYITVIDKREASFHNISSLRALVDPSLAPKLWIPFDRALQGKRSRIIQAAVAEVHPHHLVLSDGRHMTFDILLLATGSDYPSPAKIDSLYVQPGIEETRRHQRHIKQAQRVLIIGGGAVGVELAGEIASEYPDKTVTLVQAKHQLLPDEYHPGFREKARQALEKLGVHVELNDRVIVPGSQPIRDCPDTRTLRTVNGLEIDSDLQFLCIGTVVNTPYLHTLGEDDGVLTEPATGYIKVLPTLQLEYPRYRHIFAIGDCNNLPGAKLAYKAESQAKVVAKNVRRMLERISHSEDASNAKLATYKDPGAVMAVTIGRDITYNAFPFANLIGWRDVARKGVDLFLPKRYQQMNIPYPK